jgi:hypothetical protein
MSPTARRGEEKILDPTGTRTRPLCRTARNQSLCRLRYPDFRVSSIPLLIIIPPLPP